MWWILLPDWTTNTLCLVLTGIYFLWSHVANCFFLTRRNCGQSCINIIFGPIEVSTERDEDRQKRVSLQNRNLTLNFNQPKVTSSDADGYNQESFCLFIEILILKSIYFLTKHFNTECDISCWTWGNKESIWHGWK